MVIYLLELCNVKVIVEKMGYDADSFILVERYYVKYYTKGIYQI